jgi:hypothetical protein
MLAQRGKNGENTCEAWFPLTDGAESYALNPPATIAWVPSRAKDSFRSVLCVPVHVYYERKRYYTHGVFTLSTLSVDRFQATDFQLAECFARVMARAVATAWSIHGYHPPD